MLCRASQSLIAVQTLPAAEQPVLRAADEGRAIGIVSTCEGPALVPLSVI